MHRGKYKTRSALPDALGQMAPRCCCIEQGMHAPLHNGMASGGEPQLSIPTVMTTRQQGSQPTLTIREAVLTVSPRKQ